MSLTLRSGLSLGATTTLPPAILTASLTAGTLGTAYSVQLEGAGISTWTLVSGAPNGVTLSSSGVLSGTPNQSGTFASIIVRGVGSGGVVQKTLSLTVASLTFDFATDLTGWTVYEGVGATCAITSGQMRCQGAAGSGAWNNYQIYSGWSVITIEWDGTLAATSNCDFFPALATELAEKHFHSSFTPYVDDAIAADITGSGAGEKIYTTAAHGATATPYNPGNIISADTTQKHYKVVFTKVTEGTINVKVYYDNSETDSYGGSGQDITGQETLTGNAVYAGLLAWDVGTNPVDFDNFVLSVT